MNILDKAGIENATQYLHWDLLPRHYRVRYRNGNIIAPFMIQHPDAPDWDLLTVLFIWNIVSSLNSMARIDTDVSGILFSNSYNISSIICLFKGQHNFEMSTASIFISSLRV